MATYELAVTFTATRELSEAERLALLGAVLAQVEEPAGIGGSKRAEYSTVTLSERLTSVEQLVILRVSLKGANNDNNRNKTDSMGSGDTSA